MHPPLIPYFIADVWRTCYTCQHYGPSPWGDGHSHCQAHGTARRAFESCCSWVREPGADDDFPEEVKLYLQEKSLDPAEVLAAGQQPKRHTLEARCIDGSVAR